METKLTPEIRFPGFTGDWEQRKFSNIVDRVSKQSNDNNLPKVEFEDIISGEGRLNKDISQKFDDRKGIVFEPTFILFGKLRPYLKNWLLPNFKGIALGDFWVFEPKNSYSIFDYYLIQTDKYQIVANLSSGTKMPRSDWKTVSETEFSVPSIEEQIEIGNFLKQIDDIISHHQQETTILKQTKQGFLQKMFPKEGESVPEIRFPGFSGEWERRKIQEIGNLSAGGDIDKSKLVDNGKYPVLANALTNDGLVGYYDEYKIEAPAVTITGRGDVGHAKARHISFTPVVRLLALKVNGFDVDFLENCINTRNIFVESTGVPQLTAPQLGAYEILFPSFEEQIKIGNFFKQLDDTIALHQQELDALKEMKKAFLQKMFV